MEQYSNLSRIVEARNHFKNMARLKNLMSRRNLINMRQLFFVVGVVALMFSTHSCKSLGPETLRPTMKNQQLLPPLTPIFDYESFYAYFPMSITTGVVSEGVISSSTYKNPTLENFNIIFQRDVKGNICISDLEEKTNGTIKCIFIEAGVTMRIWWLIPSTLTLCTVNLLGMPFWTEKHKLQIEVSIYDRNNNRIRRYTSKFREDKSYVALYYGYASPLQKSSRLIFTKCMEDIKHQIAMDYNILNDALK